MGASSDRIGPFFLGASGLNESSQIRRVGILGLIWPLICASVLQALLVVVSLDVLASVRAYVSGLSSWSQGQQAAVHSLERYIATGDEKYFERYRTELAVPLGDRIARLAMESEPFDRGRAIEGLVAGGNAPEDIPRLIRLFRYLGEFGHFRQAMEVWRDADGPLIELDTLGNRIHDVMRRDAATLKERRNWQEMVDAIDSRLTPTANAFVGELGRAARRIQAVLVAFNIIAGAGLILLGMAAARTLLRQRQRVEAVLASEQQRASTMLASIGDAVISIDDLGCVRYMNAAAESLIGRTCGEVMRLPVSTLFRLFDEETEVRDEALVAMLLPSGPSTPAMLELHRKDGGRVAVSLVAAPLRVGSLTTGAVLVFHDMTREKQFVADLTWQASHDALTGLVNRREFDVHLRRAMSRLDTHGGQHALIYIDLDQFKVVNDTCGHDAGDQLLCQMSARLQRCLRARDTLARLGGDEFGVLLEQCPPDAALLVAEKLRRSVEELHFNAGGRGFTINASFGLVILEPNIFKPDEAMRAADLACYLAKEKGRNRIQIYSSEDAELSSRVVEMLQVQELRQALKENRFLLYAQPVVPVPAGQGEATRVELLLRLIDGSGRVVPPGGFLPAAERFGLMPQIDRWVVRNAVAMLGEHCQRDGLPIESCAINLSGATIGDSEFLDFVRQILDEYKVDPRTICFEVTETVAVKNFVLAEQFVEALQSIGCRFALDDFGAGMSSFTYLRRLPVDYVKIDGSFVKNMLSDSICYAMVEMITRLAHLMGKRTIAEFVETTDLLEALDRLGVDYAQGYAFGRPQPFAALQAGAPATTSREG